MNLSRRPNAYRSLGLLLTATGKGSGRRGVGRRGSSPDTSPERIGRAQTATDDRSRL